MILLTISPIKTTTTARIPTYTTMPVFLHVTHANTERRKEGKQGETEEGISWRKAVKTEMALSATKLGEPGYLHCHPSLH